MAKKMCDLESDNPKYNHSFSTGRLFLNNWTIHTELQVRYTLFSVLVLQQPFQGQFMNFDAPYHHQCKSCLALTICSTDH